MDEFGIQPFGDSVIMEEVEVEDVKTTASGIILPGDTDTLKTAMIMAVGPGRDGYVMMTSPGDIVLYSSNVSANEIKYKGKKYLTLAELSLSGKLRN
jgi:co-chaperonin GroES (HSP10)